MDPAGAPAPYSRQDDRSLAPPGTSPPVPRRDADKEIREVELVRRMAVGDEEALGALYDRWRTVIYAVAIRILRDRQDAEEILEDTFWQAWRNAGRYESSRGTVGSWLLTMARSRALDRARTLARRADTPLPDDTPSTKDAVNLERAEEAERVRLALRELPSEQRAALELAYFEGLSQTEIAERSQVPLGTVKTRMRLALRKLRERLSVLREEAR